MPVKLLSPHKFTKILYDGPTKDRIRLKVEASSPINVYGVASGKLHLFREDRTALVSFLDKSELDKKFSLPLEATDEWYLILENRSDEPVAAYYQLFDVP
jgi:hypothetical protein